MDTGASADNYEIFVVVVAVAVPSSVPTSDVLLPHRPSQHPHLQPLPGSFCMETLPPTGPQAVKSDRGWAARSQADNKLLWG